MATNTLSVLSQASIQDYADCPQRFKLRYLDHLNYPAVESEPALENEKHQREGQFFHRLVQQYLLGMDPARLEQLANMPSMQRWWNHFMENRPSLNGYTLYPEYALRSPLESLRLVAKYDLLAFKDGCAIIYDWKTSRSRQPDEPLAARWQTRVYMALLARCGALLKGGQDLLPENIQMRYWFADAPGDMAVFSYDAAQFQRDWNALCSIAEQILCATEYTQTNQEKKCGYCVYRSYCNRGVQAAEDMEASAELAGAAQFDVNLEQIGEIAF
jgi:RecB family exonuclease